MVEKNDFNGEVYCTRAGVNFKWCQIIIGCSCFLTLHNGIGRCLEMGGTPPGSKGKSKCFVFIRVKGIRVINCGGP